MFARRLLTPPAWPFRAADMQTNLVKLAYRIIDFWPVHLVPRADNKVGESR